MSRVALQGSAAQP